MPEFLQPKTMREALDLLQSGRTIRFLAGGTDLLVLLRAGAVTCDAVMDIKKLPELSAFAYTGAGLEIGGAVTCNQIIEADFLRGAHTSLKSAARTLANSLLRNRATLVGNLCNASPGGDMITTCLVLGGAAHTVSPRGAREIALKDFFTGVKKAALAPDELVVKVVFLEADGRGAYLKKSRGHDLAQVGLAGFYGADGALRLAAGAVGPTPVLFDALGRYTQSELLAARDVVTRIVLSSVSPIDDVRSSKEYRLAMLKYFTEKMLDAFSTGEEVSI